MFPRPSHLVFIGLQAVELHGDLPQAQRNLALSKFKGNEVDVLVATDIAARGLDIHGVLTVINAGKEEVLLLAVFLCFRWRFCADVRCGLL